MLFPLKRNLFVVVLMAACFGDISHIFHDSSPSIFIPDSIGSTADSSFVHDDQGRIFRLIYQLGIENGWTNVEAVC